MKRKTKGMGRGAYKEPGKEARPRIRGPLRRARKGVASRFFQLLSGHAMIAPFLKEKWGWTDSDRCWWCYGGRQSRDHLFKECSKWKKEIAELWREIGRISGKRGKEKEDDKEIKKFRRVHLIYRPILQLYECSFLYTTTVVEWKDFFGI